VGPGHARRDLSLDAVAQYRDRRLAHVHAAQLRHLGRHGRQRSPDRRAGGDVFDHGLGRGRARHSLHQHPVRRMVDRGAVAARRYRLAVGGLERRDLRRAADCLGDPARADQGFLCGMGSIYRLATVSCCEFISLYLFGDKKCT